MSGPLEMNCIVRLPREAASGVPRTGDAGQLFSVIADDTTLATHFDWAKSKTSRFSRYLTRTITEPVLCPVHPCRSAKVRIVKAQEARLADVRATAPHRPAGESTAPAHRGRKKNQPPPPPRSFFFFFFFFF